MACYKNETKHKCSKVVMGISIVAIIMGFLTALFGFMKSGGADDLMKKADVDNKLSMKDDLGIPTNAAVGALIIVGGIVTIITGVFGGLTVKFKKVYFAVPFVAMSFIVALLLLIGAAISLAGSGELVKEGCAFLAKDEALGMVPEKAYTDLVETNMCSKVCPCDDAFKDKFATLTPEQLTSLGRTADDLVFAPKGDNVYTEFKTCYDANTEKLTTSDDFKQKAAEWMKNKGSAALTALEEQFTKEDEGCGSMCKAPVFYWSRSIENGPPKQDCLTAFVTEMSDGTKPAGAIALISGLALIVAGIGGFPLCTGFNDKKDEPPAE